MRRSFTFIFQILERNRNKYSLLENVSKLANRSEFSCLSSYCHHAQISTFTHSKIILPDNVRSYKKETEKGENDTVGITKVLAERRNRGVKLRQAIEIKQQKIKKGMEDALLRRRAKITSTGRQIHAKGKLIIQDIKETKNKMKEKMEEVIERENVYTIPNLLCVTRIMFSPLLGYFIVTEYFSYALVFMAVAGLSDWVDGYVARNFPSQSTKIGSFLDPMADKVLIGTLFLCLTYVNLIPVPLTALIIVRDVILVTAGFVIRYRSLPPPRTLSRYFDVTHATAQLAPTFISKVNTGIQLVLVASTLAAPVFDYVDHPVLHGLWYVTGLSTIVAAASYILSKETYRYLKKDKRSKWKN